MRINGEWFPCDDGVVRPVMQGEVLAGDGGWQAALFLVDIGADRTVLSAEVFRTLGYGSIERAQKLSGIGGEVESVVIPTQIRLRRDDDVDVVFRGDYAALADLQALDMSVLGRDILGLFAVIADRPGDAVALIRDRHRYTIEIV